MFTARYVPHSTFYPHSLFVLCGSENKQRLFHCTALTGWLVFTTEMQCLLRGPDCFRKYNSGLFPRTVLLLIPY